MENKKSQRGPRTTKEQFNMMVSTMQKYPVVAMGVKHVDGNPYAREQCKSVWIDLAQRLNDIGPPNRSILVWQKVWNDLRLKVKKRHDPENVVRVNRASNLQSHELAVGKILGWNKNENHQGTSFVASPESSFDENQDNDTSTSDIIVKEESRCSLESQISEENITKPLGTGNPDCPDPLINPQESPGKIRKANNSPVVRDADQKTLLEQQNELLEVLVENSNQQVQYMRESLKVQKQKFEFKRKHLETMEKIKQDELKLRAQMLECRKLELELKRAANDDESD